MEQTHGHKQNAHTGTATQSVRACQHFRDSCLEKRMRKMISFKHTHDMLTRMHPQKKHCNTESHNHMNKTWQSFDICKQLAKWTRFVVKSNTRTKGTITQSV